jgi:hypothetical protein
MRPRIIRAFFSESLRVIPQRAGTCTDGGEKGERRGRDGGEKAERSVRT